MADRLISELIQATEVTDSDLFVLQQGGMAKKLSGSTLKDYVVLDVVSAEAQTLPAGSEATANYDQANKALKIGVPTGPQGATGDAGKSAYASAQDGGYTGTEAQFNASLGALINIESVDALPESPDANTLYLIREV